MPSIKKTIKQIRRPGSRASGMEKVMHVIGASVDDARISLSGNHNYSLRVLEVALALEKDGRQRTTMIQLLNRAIKKAKG
ncbi:MAG: hypothetical protein ACN4GR_16275 [Arenicellales bacterium]